MTMRHEWLTTWMKAKGNILWAAADLVEIPVPPGAEGYRVPRAISFAIPMLPRVMADIREGPTRAYADEYRVVNDRLDRLSEALTAEIIVRGFGACAVPASERIAPLTLRGVFPHKTAATRAGLGWIGRHCQLITRPFGPWVRLGTVLTDLPLRCGSAHERSHCGRCRRCVEACPARALTGGEWRPGISRDDLLNADACEAWKKTHYHKVGEGRVCGICSSVCPYGLKSLKSASSKPHPSGRFMVE